MLGGSAGSQGVAPSRCVCAQASMSCKTPCVCVCDLCRSQLFYYSAGISFGLLASLLILVYMMSKVMPKVSVRLPGGERPHSISPFCTCTVVLVGVLEYVALWCWVVDLALHGARLGSCGEVPITAHCLS